jgi:hypothetical protein
MENIEKWTAQPDGQYEHLSTIYEAVVSQYQRYSNHVYRYLTGRYTNNVPDQKNNEFVPAALRKEALEWLGRNVMVAPMWLYPESIVEKLGVNYVNEITNMQQSLITRLLSTESLTSQQTAVYQSQENYTVEEYLNDVFNMVWQPLGDKDDEQSSIRRGQQRAYVDALGSALNPSQSSGSTLTIINGSIVSSNSSANSRQDAILYYEQHLDKVEQYLKSLQGDGINGLHYKNLLLRIKKIREKYESGK